jgi:hypothetical protein
LSGLHTRRGCAALPRLRPDRLERTDRRPGPLSAFERNPTRAISPEQFIAALTDFSARRPEPWPNHDTRFYELHELGDTWAEVTEGTDVLGGVWAREHYDRSEPGHVQLRLVESPHFEAGTTIDYRVTSARGGGYHVEVVSERIATSVPGHVVGLILRVIGTRRFATDLANDTRTAGRVAAVIRHAPADPTGCAGVPLARCPSSPSTA